MGIGQMPSDSTLNVNNALGLSRTEIDLHMRSDLTYKNNKNEVMIKPRLILQNFWRFDGIYDGESEFKAVPFFTEWRLQRKLTDNVIASYGAENLQWGPAQLVSCSNPFLVQNGRSVPNFEVPGLEYGRLIWVPNSTWSASAIINTGKGLLPAYGEFQKTYAGKLDWTGDRKTASVIVSHTERRCSELGYYGIWNVSDPCLVYTEGRISENEDRTFLVGGSYTLESSQLLTLELYNDNLGKVPLVENLPTRWQIIDGAWRPLCRTTVAMLQYNSGSKFRKFNGNIRVDHIFDYGSRLTASVNRSLGQSKQLWAACVANSGPQGTGFRLYTDYTGIVGLTHTF